MKSRFVLLLTGFLVAFIHAVSAQSRDPYFSTFSANYDVVYHEPGATSNAGGHVASTFRPTCRLSDRLENSASIISMAARLPH